ncbi:MAG: hypothetical protein RIE06_33700 [Roseibium album]|uniref:hypothetical protein n=1 Tax=Roseibium album TaxID=311410 RepID=UPI0032ED362F
MASETSATANNASFWSDAFLFPESATPNPNPTHSIPGSSDGNTSSQANQGNAETDFPFLDGSSEDTRLPPPLDEDGNPIDLQTVDLADISPDLFSGSFHSAHQLELLHRFGGALVLGTGSDRLDVLMGADGRTVLTLQQIPKNDLAQLSFEDQILVANYLADSTVPDAVKELLAFTWEVTVGDSVDNNRAAAAALIDAAIDAIKAAGSSYDEVYIEQLETLKALLGKNALFSQTALQTQISEVTERFERMHAFEAVEAQTAINNAPDGFHTGLNSQDGNTAILSGLQIFLEQEQRYLDIQKQRLAVASTGSSLDLPTLVATLQLIYNVKQEAEVAILTEELQQQNELLKDYAEMQRIANEVLKSFPSGSDADEEKRNAAGGSENEGFFDTSGIAFPDRLSDDDLRALLMFDSAFSGAAAGSAHPLEDLRGITRPLADLFGNLRPNGTTRFVGALNALEQSDWNLMSTQLADAVTLINQQSQILSNDISAFNQQSNRHFDLGNSALRRMMDLINTIARV